MRITDDFYKLVIPFLKKIPEWETYFNAIFDEMVELSRNNLGTYNQLGFSGSWESFKPFSLVSITFNPVYHISHFPPDTPTLTVLGDSTTEIEIQRFDENHVHWTGNGTDPNFASLNPGDYIKIDGAFQLTNNSDIYRVISSTATSVQLDVNNLKPEIAIVTYGTLGVFANGNYQSNLDKMFFNKTGTPNTDFAVFSKRLHPNEPYNIRITGKVDVTTPISITVKSGTNQLILTGSSTTGDIVLEGEIIADGNHITLERCTENIFFDDVEIYGVNTDAEWKELILKRVMDIDEAERIILENMRDSLQMPQIANMDEESLRILKRNFFEFKSVVGSAAASKLFFYFLGYEVEIGYLYSTNDDYNQVNSSFVPQKKDDTFLSTFSGPQLGQIVTIPDNFTVEINPATLPVGLTMEETFWPGRLVFYDDGTGNTLNVAQTVEGNNVTFLYEVGNLAVNDIIYEQQGKIWGQVAAGGYSSMMVMEPGHELVKGDVISNMTNPFVPLAQTVVSRVDGLNVFLANVVAFNEHDILEVYREYTYSVNPNPSQLFKTPHIDVSFKKKYNQSVNLPFVQLKEFFHDILPANVVIRFIGFSIDQLDEDFQIIESRFDIEQLFVEDIIIQENLVHTPDPDIWIYVNTLPFTGFDIFATPCDQYSWAVDPFNIEYYLL